MIVKEVRLKQSLIGYYLSGVIEWSLLLLQINKSCLVNSKFRTQSKKENEEEEVEAVHAVRATHNQFTI